MLSHETKATEEQKETKAMSITEAVFQNEEAFLLDIAGVLEAIDTYETYAVHPVIREGKTIFSFRIRGLGADEMEKCRSEATKTEKNRKLGIKIPADFDSAKYDSLLIVQATHPEDAQKLWKNKDLVAKVPSAIAPWMLVDKVLKSGEKEAVLAHMEKLSSYGDEDQTLAQTVKNS